MSFAIFQNAKTPFQAIKKRSSKSWKFYFFPRGLTHVFGPKVVSFPTFFLGNIGQENVSDYILERKNAFLGYKNKKFKQSKNCHFSKGVNSWFWSKKGHFSNFFFQAIQARKMTLTIFQNEKTLFQAIKTTSSKSRKIDVFPKWLTDSFGPKKAIFPTFFLGNVGQENVFYDILERKRVNLHGFCPKMAILQIFFWQYRPVNCLLRHSRSKKRLSRL